MLNESMLFGEIEKDLVQELKKNNGIVQVLYSRIANKISKIRPSYEKMVKDFFKRMLEKKRICHICEIDKNKVVQTQKFREYVNIVKRVHADLDIDEYNFLKKSVEEFRLSDNTDDNIQLKFGNYTVDIILVKKDLSDDRKAFVISRCLIAVIQDFKAEEDPGFDVDKFDEMIDNNAGADELLDFLGITNDSAEGLTSYLEIIANPRTSQILGLDLFKEYSKNFNPENVVIRKYDNLLKYLDSILDLNKSYEAVLITCVEVLNRYALSRKINTLDFRRKFVSVIKTSYFACIDGNDNTKINLLNVLENKGLIRGSLGVLISKSPDNRVYLTALTLIIKMLGTDKQNAINWFKLVEEPYMLFGL